VKERRISAHGETLRARRQIANQLALDHTSLIESQHSSLLMESIPPAPGAQQLEAADSATTAGLFASLYGDLRSLAERQLRRSNGVPLSPTTLLHEAYLGMSGRSAQFPDHDRFMGYAARVMRGLIIDFVRERRALKRGSDFHITHLPADVVEAVPDERELAQLSEAIDTLAVRDPRLAQVVDLKYFCGYSFEEIAALQVFSVRTVLRDWEKARAVLYQQLEDAI
jgi:RNA polymerase sigma factor (TIGR02999 family)